MPHSVGNATNSGTGGPPSANTGATLIDELEAAIAGKDMRRQADIMRRVTDLFMLHGTGFTGEQIAMFDEVMSRLLTAIEKSARATFGERLASISICSATNNSGIGAG